MPEVSLAHAHALRLRENPAGAWSHLLVRQVEHIPEKRDPREKFRVKRAGIFYLEDAMRGLERHMSLSQGKGPEWIRAELERNGLPKPVGWETGVIPRWEDVRVPKTLPMLVLSVGNGGVDTYLFVGRYIHPPNVKPGGDKTLCLWTIDQIDYTLLRQQPGGSAGWRTVLGRSSPVEAMLEWEGASAAERIMV